MLQKGFFLTESFNMAGTILVDISGSQQFVETTVFPKGVYKVEAAAGASFRGSATDTPYPYNLGCGLGGKVVTEVAIQQPFTIVAYSGSKGNYGQAGNNPYEGAFKVNANNVQQTPPTVNHIFGNAGGIAMYNGDIMPGSGNCLGNGVTWRQYWGLGAGTCVHFLPVGGTFGTDYLFAAHCCAAASGWSGSPTFYGGNGSAYGGASGGWGRTLGTYAVIAYDGGTTPYGVGGTGSVGNTGPAINPSGTGIGAGIFDGIKVVETGSAAYFDGLSWQTSSDTGELLQDGYVKVTFVRPI